MRKRMFHIRGVIAAGVLMTAGLAGQTLVPATLVHPRQLLTKRLRRLKRPSRQLGVRGRRIRADLV